MRECIFLNIAMFPISKFLFAFTLITTSTIISADDIPVMLWNIKGNSLPIKPVSALGQNDKVLYESLKDAIHQESNILVFAVNKLSLENFSASDESLALNNTLENIESFLDVQPHMLLPSVKDPLNYIHKAHCGVQEIVVDNKIDDIVIQAVSKALQRSCVVVLHVSDDGIVTKEGQLKTVFLPTFEKSKKNLIGIFTGVKSSWGSNENERHIFRNLLVAADPDNIVNYKDCILMYAENATITLAKETNTSVSLPIPNVPLDGSECGNSSSLLQLNFKTSGILSTVTIILNFTKVRSHWKTQGTVSMTGDKAVQEELDLTTESVSAARGFSYSCGRIVWKGKNSSVDVEIVMEKFQVQPFDVKEGFSDSFDCVTWFTIPIWMGIIVSIMFIVILNIGIYALFSLNTMDRFDDPKGKTISVGTTAD